MQPVKPLKILALGLNYEPELIGIAVYTQGLAESLVERGHDVHVVAGKPYYPSWKVFEGFRGGWKRRSVERGVDVTRVAHYVPNNPTGVRRIVHHLSFALSSLIPTVVRALWYRPDVVVTIAPSLISAPVAWLSARLCGAPCWLHIQDFEVEAAIATGLADGTGTAMALARRFENWVLGLFDRVSSISPAMCRKLTEKGVQTEHVVEFRNWANVDAIKPMTGDSPYRAEWGIETPHVALYSGNIANKQGIESVVETARLMQKRQDLTFVICGNGPNRAKLEASIADLTNIRFHDLQDADRLGDLLGLACVHLLVQRGQAADLMLPSKMANMLASGRPVVATADPGTGIATEVEGCGLVVRPDDPEALARALEQLLNDSRLLEDLGRAARRRAEERWKQSAIIDVFEDEILKLDHEKLELRHRTS